MRLNKIGFALLLALFVLCFVSCDRNEVYYKFREIETLQWSKHDTLYFEVDSTLVSPDESYKITIEVSHNSNYPYSNIWLYAQDNINDSVFQNYSQQYSLADEYGKWFGSGFGSVYQMSLNYRSAVRFKDKRNYTIKLIHGMRDEPLKGIEKIGIKVEKEE